MHSTRSHGTVRAGGSCRARRPLIDTSAVLIAFTTVVAVGAKKNDGVYDAKEKPLLKAERGSAQQLERISMGTLLLLMCSSPFYKVL